MTFVRTRHRCALALALAYSLVGEAAASPPPEQVVREFYAYLAASDRRTEAPNIRDDTAAQEHWLSQALRDSLRRANAAIRRLPRKRDEIPVTEFDSASLRFGWDPPGRFVITRTAKAPFTAIVAGVMVWGPRQQYAGSRRNASFVLVMENGAWRVDDIQVEPYGFDQSTDSLRALLAADWQTP